MSRQAVAELVATPNPVPYGAGSGATTITWSTGDGSPGRIYLSVDGGPEQLFAGGPRGAQEAPWISAGVTYEFRLYAGETDRQTPLSTVTVTRTGIPWETVFEELIQRVSQEEHSDDVARLLAKLIRVYLDSPAYHKTFRLWEELGFHLTPVHFYQPIPDTGALADDLWKKESELIGISMNDTVQLGLLRDAFTRFRSEYEQFPMDSSDRPYGFYLNNHRFDGTDALVLYCMVRHFRPNYILEVGSGFSSRMAAEAALKNGNTKLICVDPYLDSVLADGFPGLTHTMQRKVEEVSLDTFQQLGANDILFIDSSHVVKCGGDVNYLVLEVLPRLKAGVIVHVHDIFLPKEYPESWIKEHLRFYSEQYLLHAFLSFNSDYEILLCNNYLGHKHQDELRAAFPNSPWWGGGSLWMRRKLQ